MKLSLRIIPTLKTRVLALTTSVLVSCFVIVTGVALSPLTSTSAHADNRDKQSGEINITLEDKKKTKSYKQMSHDVTAKFHAFYNSIVGKTLDEYTAPPTFDSDELQYIAAVHLHCTLRSGACPLIPQAMYEMELVRSALADSPSCKVLPKFWKKWIESDMEKRVEHKLKVVHFNKRNRFKTKIRPKYLRCLTSVKELPEDNIGKNEYLTARYKENTSYVNAPKKFALYLEKVNAKIPNIFVATEMQRRP